MHATLSDAEVLFLEGNLLMEQGDADGAESCFRIALTLAPHFGEAMTNLALLRERAGATDEAEQLYRHALPLLPDSPALRSNLGVLLACAKRETEAEQCYRAALALDAGHRHARFNLSYVLLRQGRMEEGWACLEARTIPAPLGEYFHAPRWSGEAIAGKSIVLGFEAGHGDMIQFCRYLPMLKKMGARRVALVCHPALTRLFRTLEGVDELYAWDEPVAADGWDFWGMPMSLPYCCGTRPDTIPAPIPYLTATPSDIARWRTRLPQAGLRVGLVWRGNAHFENDAQRSLPSLDLLAPLGHVEGIRFVSLQKGPGQRDALQPPAGLTLLPLGERLEDFADTAAVVAQLDLVISVDTAVAHLAGSLGTPCWILLPKRRPDWRWTEGRADTPWYPRGTRLYWQSTAGDWSAVIALLVDELASWRRAQPPR